MKKSQMPTKFSSDESEEGIISFPDILLALAHQIRTIILIPFAFCVITIFYVLFISDRVFKSESKIISSSSSNTGMSQAVGLAAQFGISIPNSQSEQKMVYPEILKSRNLCKQVLKQKFDSKQFGKQKSLLSILTGVNVEGGLSSNKLESLAIESLLKLISIKEDKLTGVISIAVHAGEPNLAAEINNVFIDQLDRHQRNHNKLKTSEARKFIQERINDTEKELQIVENKLKNFMDRNRRIENSPALQLEQQRLEREVTVLTGVFTTLKQQLEMTKIEEVKDSNNIIVLDQPSIPIRPAKPRRTLSVVLAGVLGLGMATFFAIIKELSLRASKVDLNKISEAKYIFFKNIFPSFLREKS